MDQLSPPLCLPSRLSSVLLAILLVAVSTAAGPTPARSAQPALSEQSALSPSPHLALGQRHGVGSHQHGVGSNQHGVGLSRPLAARPFTAPPSDEFEVEHYEVSVPGQALPGDGSQAAVRSAHVSLEGDPSMVVLVPERPTHAGYAIRSKNENGWSDWIEVESAEDEAPDGLPGEEGHAAPIGLGPVWIGADAEAIEVASLGSSVGLTIETLEPIDQPEQPLVANALPGRPTIQPRSNWTTRGYVADNDGCEGGPHLATNIRAAVVHHTVTGNSYSVSDVDDQLRAIYRLHVDINGWCDIAYNFVVDRFGNIWEARSGGVEEPVIGGHAKGFNTWTVGIALLGQHQAGASPPSTAPTTAAMAAVQSLIGWKLGLHGVDPDGTTWLKNRSSNGLMKFPSQSWVQVPTVLGHRDLGVTSCPGSHTMPSLPGIRAALIAGRVGDPPYSFVAHEPYEHGPGIVVLDEVGGVRPAGAAEEPLAGLVPGGTGAVAVGGGPTGGYVLTNDSTLVDYGTAPTVNGRPSGSNNAIDLQVRSDGSSGWVLDDAGGVHSFGGAANPSSSSGAPVAFDLDDAGTGYWVDSSGRLTSIGGAEPASLRAGMSSIAIDVAVLPGQIGGWVLGAGGELSAFGEAEPHRLPGGPIEARAVLAALNGRGGWVLDSEGRLHPFGDERPILPISTTVGVPTAVDGALVDWIADDRSDLIRFVDALATLFLGEPMAPLDADFVASRVVYEGRSVVVDELAHSDAWAGQLVDQLFVDVLGRPADPQGRAYWVAELANGTRTQDLGAFFYGSPEYYAAAGSPEAYVSRLYEALLDRPADRAGLAFWVERLENGSAVPTDISAGFYQSPESRLGRVDALYAQVLDRAPDEQGRAFWADRLYQIDDIELAIELASSAEYYNLTTDSGGD